MNDKKRSYLLIGTGIACFIIAAVMLHMYKGKFAGDSLENAVSAPVVMEDTVDVSKKAPASNSASAVTQTNQTSDIWVIYITGAVKKPGVYKMPSGSRVYQALEVAGGFAGNADQEAVNLAATLGDGMHAHFPRKGENAQPVAQPSGAAAGKTPQTQNSTPPGALININTATQAELETLPGIGPKAAQAIISYRETNGFFTRPEDIMLVKGIGPKKYDNMKSLVSVGK